MKEIKIYLLLSILMNFALICCGYLITQFDGEFVNGMKIDFRIEFFGPPDKYLLQAIDTNQNKFSIKTSKTYSVANPELIIDFNGLTYNDNGMYYYNYDNIFYFNVVFEFKQNNLYYENYGGPSSLLLSNVFNSGNKKIDSTLDWPDSRDLQNMTTQTKIWLTYSNQVTNDDSNFDWVTNEIIGCRSWLKVNDKVGQVIEQRGYNFGQACMIRDAMESVCKDGNCVNTAISLDRTINCKSILEMNPALHCYPDLSKNIDSSHSYEKVGDDTEPIFAKFAWLTQQSTNQCLMEIITRNDSVILIYLNSSNQIILAIKHDKSINWSNNILYEISAHRIYILKLELTQSDSVFKVSNGNFIKTLILPNIGSVKTINVGWSLKTGLCQKLTSKFVFRHDASQFRFHNLQTKFHCIH